jgi:lipopolysaccharide biosynthesis glycosyltransferase
MGKKLIYYSINENYLDTLDIALNSLRENKTEDIDILIITNSICEEVLLEKHNDLLYHVVEKKHTSESMAGQNKYKIATYDGLENYEKVIYLDSDTLVIKDINILFDYMDEDEVYTNQGYGSDLSHKTFSFGLTGEEIKQIKSEKKFGLNSGVFGFTKKQIPFMKLLNDFVQGNKHNKLEASYDQPFFGTFMYRNNKTYKQFGCPLHSPDCENVLINNEGIHNSHKNLDTVVIVHFAGQIGLGGMKRNHMIKFLNSGYINTPA